MTDSAVLCIHVEEVVSPHTVAGNVDRMRAAQRQRARFDQPVPKLLQHKIRIIFAELDNMIAFIWRTPVIAE